MTTSLSFDQHLDVIAQAVGALTKHAAAAGTDADVPTCPRWTVVDLLAHMGIVHRWAAANLRGDDSATPSKTAILREVPADELVGWVRAGADALLATLRETPADVRAMVFLNDAPPPRDFWARRQAHETTVHGADALAASLGRVPTAAEVDVPTDVAVDGVDELLRGFFTRGKSKIADGDPFTIRVDPADSDRRWTMHVDGERLRTTDTAQDAPDAVFAGTAAQLYLGLWNRGTEIAATGQADLLARWRKAQRVRWS